MNIVCKLHVAAPVVSTVLKCSSCVRKSVPATLKALSKAASCIADHAQIVSGRATLDPDPRQAAAHTSHTASQHGNTLQLPVPQNKAMLQSLAQQGCCQLVAPKAEHLDMQLPRLTTTQAATESARESNAQRDQMPDSTQQDKHIVTSHTHTESAMQCNPLQQQGQQHEAQHDPRHNEQHSSEQQRLQHGMDAAGEANTCLGAAEGPGKSALQAHQEDSDSLSSLSPSLQLDIPGFHACLASDASSYLHHHQPSQHSQSQPQLQHITLLNTTQQPQQEQEQHNCNQQQLQTTLVERSEGAAAADFALTDADLGEAQHQPQQASSTIVTQASLDVMVEIVQDVVQDTQPADCSNGGQTGAAAAGPEVPVSPAELALNDSLQALSDLPDANLPLADAAQQLEDQQQQEQGGACPGSPHVGSQEAVDQHERHQQHQQLPEHQQSPKQLSVSQPKPLSEQHPTSWGKDKAFNGAQQALAASVQSSEQPQVSTASQQQHSRHSTRSSDVSQECTHGPQEQAGEAVQADAANEAVQQEVTQINIAGSALPHGVMPAHPAQIVVPDQTTHQSSGGEGQAPDVADSQPPLYADSDTHIGVQPQQPCGSSAKQPSASGPQPPSCTHSHAYSGSESGRSAESDAQQSFGGTEPQSGDPFKQQASRGHAEDSLVEHAENNAAERAEQTAARSMSAGGSGSCEQRADSQHGDSALRRKASAVAAKKVAFKQCLVDSLST